MTDSTQRWAPPSGGADPRPEHVRVEVERLERRWRQLPLDTAEAALPRLRVTLDRLTAAAGQSPVPDLGPGTSLHQLTVLVWEASRRAQDAGSAAGADGTPDLLGELTALRRDLP